MKKTMGYHESKPLAYLHDRTAVRSGAEIGLLRFRLRVSRGVSLGDFLVAPACPIENILYGANDVIPVKQDDYVLSFLI